MDIVNTFDTQPYLEPTHVHNKMVMELHSHFCQSSAEFHTMNQASRKRKGEELSVCEPSSVFASLGMNSDFVVLENEKRKHIKVVSHAQPKPEAGTHYVWFTL